MSSSLRSPLISPTSPQVSSATSSTSSSSLSPSKIPKRPPPKPTPQPIVQLKDPPQKPLQKPPQKPPQKGPVPAPAPAHQDPHKDPHKDPAHKDSPHKDPAHKASSTRSVVIEVSKARPLWDRPWRTGNQMTSSNQGGFNIVQFFEYVKVELERELRGELAVASATNGEAGNDGLVDAEMVHSLKERVAAEFEKTKRSFEEEMEQLKRVLKANPNMSAADLEKEMMEASRRISNLLNDQNDLEKKLDAALNESKVFSARLEKFSKNIEYISQKAPEGRVTLVFTDVQGSTTQWEMHPHVMEKALELHDGVMRTFLEEFSGYEVKTEGDAFFASFERAVDATRFCLKVQEELLKVEWPEDVFKHPDSAVEVAQSGTLLYKGLRVRMGVHTGEPTCNKNPITGRMDYFGPMVNRSARIESVAKGGQIVLSDATLAEIENFMEPLNTPQIKDLGMFKLKGLDSDQRIYQMLPMALSERIFEVEAPSAPKILEPAIGPKGDVTLVFTDVKSSTALWEMDATVMKHALQLHNELMRSLLAVHGGYEVKTEGDAFMIAFGDPLTAIMWAAEVQLKLLEVDWPEKIYEHPDAKIEHGPDGELLYRGLKVRMGIHTGQPLAEEDPVTRRTDYFGPMVNRSARVESVAAGGQLMVSGSTWEAIKERLTGDLGPKFDCKYMGEYELKGLEGKEKITQVLPAAISKRVFDVHSAKKEAKGERGPKGNLAVVCTAIQGSNRQWNKNAEIMKKAFSIHNSILRKLIGDHNGYEVKVQGDSFIVVFADPLDAIKWSLMVQESLLDYSDWPEELLQNDDSSVVKDVEGNVLLQGLRVRIGLHYGQVLEEADPITGRSTYYGPVINTAVQLEKISHGGQIVLTSELWENVREAAKGLSPVIKPLSMVEIENNHFCNLYQMVPKRVAARKFSNLRTTTSKSGPTGKVTLVFTDIQGSTPQWDADPETMEQALQLHNEVFRNLMRDFHGYEVKTEGDAFMIAFTNAADAVRYCIKIQYALLEVNWPEKLYWNPESAIEIDEGNITSYRGLRVRMGLLTGEPICSEDPITGRTDYFGPVVNRAARVQSAANGGQIIMSGSTWAEIEPVIDTLEENGVPLGIRLGEFRLKGLDSKEPLIELKPSGLKMRQFPAPFSKIESSQAKEATAKMGNLTKTNNQLSANLNTLNVQFASLSEQSHAMQQEMAALEARYVAATSTDDEQAQKQKLEFLAITQKMEKLLHSQQRLETQLNGTSQESKEFNSILGRIQADSMAEANKIAEQVIESVASKHRMEIESNKAKVAELTANVLELESSLNDYRADKEAMEEELMEKTAEYETALMRESDLLNQQRGLQESVGLLEASLEQAKQSGNHTASQMAEDLQQQQQRAEKLEAELATLRQEKSSLGESQQNQQTKLEEIQESLRASETRAAELQDTIKNLQSALEDNQQKHLKLREDEKRESAEEATRLAKEVESFKSQYEEASAKLRDALASSQTSLGTAAQDKAEAEERLKTVREELTKKMEELASASSLREEELQGKIQQMTQGKGELEEKKAEVIRELDASKRDIETLRSETVSLTTQIKEREERLAEGAEKQKATEAAHQQEVEKITSQIDSLTQQLQEHQKQCEGHLASLEEKGVISSQLEEVRGKLADKIQALEATETSLGNSTQEVQKMTQEISTLQARREEVEAQLAAAQGVEKSQKTRLEELTQDIAALQASVKAANEETEKAKAEAEARVSQVQEQEQELARQLEEKTTEFAHVESERNEYKAKLDEIEEAAKQKAAKRISRGSGLFVSKMLDKFEENEKK